MSLKEHLESKSEETEWSLDELIDTNNKLQDVFQENYNQHVVESQIGDGYDYILKRCVSDDIHGFWMGLTEDDLYNTFQQSSVVDEFNRKRLFDVAASHFSLFQSMGYTVGVPPAVDEKLPTPFHYAVRIERPNDAYSAEECVSSEFRIFLKKYDFNPAEAIDYWAIEIVGYSPKEWASDRGVGAEAVRKNVRQARSKMGEKSKEKSLQAIEIEKINNSGVDVDQNLIYPML